MADERDRMPVLTVTDKEGYTLEAGDPSTYDNIQLEDFLNDGCEIKIIQFKEYATMQRKWIWSKPAQEKIL